MVLDDIFLVRHAPSVSNRGGYIQGQIDTRLVPGHRTLIDHLTDLIVEVERLTPSESSVIHTFSSDSQRTYQTGDRIHRRLWDEHHIKSMLTYTNLLRERSQGNLEGMPFGEAIPILSPNTNLPPTAENIYPLLYLSNSIPNGERHEAVKARLEQFLTEYVYRPNVNGIGIIAAHLISGMNYLRNMLTDGDMLARDYRNYPNLSVVRLSLDRNNFMRYVETGRYGPPNDNQANAPTISVNH